MNKIKIAKDFSKTPGARYPDEGDYSGQEFREKVLLPKLKDAINQKIKLQIDFDGTAGFGTSFLEEAFGGLIRVDKIKYNDIVDNTTWISNDDPEYIDEVKSYLKEAYEMENK